MEPHGRELHLLAAFEALAPDSLGDPGRQQVWRALVDLGATHRQFADADWAMPGEVVERVEAAAAHFAPLRPAPLTVTPLLPAQEDLLLTG